MTRFRRFLSLLASRHRQVHNRTDLAAPLGVTVFTLSERLRIHEVIGQDILVPLSFENFGKRLVKSPKVYWGDAGLVCQLLGVQCACQARPLALSRRHLRGICRVRDS